MRFWFCTGCALLASLGSACMWDTDTLAMEAKGLPVALRVIVGRFERNPPLYYEMRLRRVSQEVRSKPGDLALYDDAGVACARLGRNDEAIAWMERKRQAMESARGTGAPDSEHLYRYHANLGTFLIHRWLAAGCPKDRIADARNSRAHIAKAIEINPDAHFGREFAQLAAMDGIIAVKTGKAKEFEIGFANDRQAAGKNTEGLCGLIVLGAAWESVDIFDALARQLSMDMQASLAYLAVLRRNELLDAGRKPLACSAEAMRSNGSESRGSMVYDNVKPGLQADFLMLREDAKRYHKARTAYMLERLKAGRHPDTDPAFWNQWKEPPMPALPYRFSMSPARMLLLTIGGVSLLVAIALALVIRRRRARARAA